MSEGFSIIFSRLALQIKTFLFILPALAASTLQARTKKMSLSVILLTEQKPITTCIPGSKTNSEELYTAKSLDPSFRDEQSSGGTNGQI